MLDHLMDAFIEQPRRLVALGQWLVRIAGFLLVAGVAGWAATTSMSVVTGTGGRTRPEFELNDVLPGGLTWWIPESFLDFTAVALLLVVGLVVLRQGRTYERLLRL